MSKKQVEIDLDHIKPEEKMKYEIAEELGYLDKVMETGWKSLTAKESGRIGGIITKRRKEIKNQMKNEMTDESNHDLNHDLNNEMRNA